jgi:hypothetical protein
MNSMAATLLALKADCGNHQRQFFRPLEAVVPFSSLRSRGGVTTESHYTPSEERVKKFFARRRAGQKKFGAAA